MGGLDKILTKMPSQGHLLNFNSAKCKNRTSCREGLRPDNVNQPAPTAQNHTVPLERLLSPSARGEGEEKNPEARRCFHLSSALSPSCPCSCPLSLHLPLTPSVPSVSSYLASSGLCHRPAPPSSRLGVTSLRLGDQFPSYAPTPSRGPPLPSGAACLWVAWVSQTLLRIALLPNSHLCPLPFSKSQTLNMFREVEFQSSVR